MERDGPSKGLDGFVKGPPMSDDPHLPAQIVATAPLLRRTHTTLTFAPDAAARSLIAAALDLIELPAFRLEAEAAPSGKRDLVLTGRLTARAVQACSVTLLPVEARIDEPLLRRYLADFQAPDGTEVEMPEDDTTDPLADSLDLAAVAIEALALALPLYPRAPGADLGAAVFAPPGAAPLRDADLRPFAGLAALVGKPEPGREPGGED